VFLLQCSALCCSTRGWPGGGDVRGRVLLQKKPSHLEGDHCVLQGVVGCCRVLQGVALGGRALSDLRELLQSQVILAKELSFCGSPLTEEIRFKLFGCADLPDFRVDLLSDADSVYTLENSFENLGTRVKMCLMCTKPPVRCCWTFWQS